MIHPTTSRSRCVGVIEAEPLGGTPMSLSWRPRSTGARRGRDEEPQEETITPSIVNDKESCKFNDEDPITLDEIQVPAIRDSGGHCYNRNLHICRFMNDGNNNDPYSVAMSPFTRRPWTHEENKVFQDECNKLKADIQISLAKRILE